MSREYYTSLGLNVKQIAALLFVDTAKKLSRLAHSKGEEYKDVDRNAENVVNSEPYKQAKEIINNYQGQFVSTEIDF